MIWPGKNKYLQKAIIMVYVIRSMSMVNKTVVVFMNAPQ